jgi:hypothetical protein
MPNTHETLSSLFTDIANAIRTKKGESSSVTYVADNFPSAIAGIPVQIGYTNVTPITDQTGSVTIKSSRLEVDVTIPRTSGAMLYCVMLSDIHQTSAPDTVYAVFNSFGTILYRSIAQLYVTASSTGYSISLRKSATTGNTHWYRFSGFTLS